MAADLSNPVDMGEISKSHAISHDIAEEKVPAEKGLDFGHQKELSTGDVDEAPLNGAYPTEEEFRTLRRVPGTLRWPAYTVAFVELCERFSYYGTTQVFVNFIQRPRPENSPAGAGYDRAVPGALGMGQRASTGLTLFNSFWSYVMPLAGAFVADQYLGRFRTIMWSIALALIGHSVLVISAIPPVIDNPNGAIACFAVGLVIMGMGTGGFKSNISVLISEQYEGDKAYTKTLPSGERVIVDPASTVSRIYLYFYLMINVGSICGQVSMVYAERYVGFWLSFFLPTVMFCLCPLVLFVCRKSYILTPPTGSVYTQAFRLWKLAMQGRWSLNPARLWKKSDPFWESVKPSKLGDRKPEWMIFDDEWVDEVARGMKACKVFLWYPLYWLA